MNYNPSVRLLMPADAAVFHAIRIRACKEEPSSFFDTYQEASDLSLHQIGSYFESSWIAGFFLDTTLVGITGLRRYKGAKTKHRGMIWGVYVAPEARGLGGSKRMIDLLLDEATNADIEIVMLSTNVANDIIVNIYKSLGFTPCGMEKHILKLDDGSYVDDICMIKELV